MLHWLTGAGVGSRRRCFQLITAGEVLVNGRAILDVTAPVDPDADVVEAAGQRVRAAEPRVYIKLNKPAGVVSTRSDEHGRPTVMELVPSALRRLRLYPVGRLDAETTGLLLLTNDGDLAHGLTHPKFEVEKEYHARLDGPLSVAQRQALEAGVAIEGRKTAPAKVVRLRRSEAFWYAVLIHEGRKRQVRRMMLAVGRSVRALTRVRIGPLDLGDLEAGQARRLTQAEIAVLKRLASPRRIASRGAKR